MTPDGEPLREWLSRSEAETREAGREFAGGARAGTVVLLEGELGAGKTTFVRGVLEGLGYEGPVRSPTFNLIQTFDTDPPVMHADLYRMTSEAGLGLEDYLTAFLCFVEWPDRLSPGFLNAVDPVRIRIEFVEEGRRIMVHSPRRPDPS